MRRDDGRVVPTFIAQALRGEPLTVFGDGSQTRSFCYVDDIVDGMWRLLHVQDPDPVNIGNPQEMTILEFARSVQRLCGREVAIVHRPLPQDDPRVRRPDITRARNLLGWEPRVEFDEGMRRSIDYVRQQNLREAHVAGRILVTGGAGFIGSHHRGPVRRSRMGRLGRRRPLLGQAGERPRPGPLLPVRRADAAVAEAVERERPDVLCHHAAPNGRPPVHGRSPVRRDVNIGGLVNLLSAAARAGVRHVLFASSGGAAYGETDRIPTPEDEPNRPVSVYGASKASSELFLGVWRAAHGITSTALRYATSTGPVRTRTARRAWWPSSPAACSTGSPAP